MSRHLAEVVFILDRSGSMTGLEEDTIGGYNAAVERQKQTEGEVKVTTVLFDDRIERLYDRVPLGCVVPMTEKEYYVRGCTALLDAVGQTISYLVEVQKHALPEDRAEKVIFLITTDGYENASREYTYRQIRKMIEEETKEYGWEFIFVGANMDAVKAAAEMGIRSDRAVNYVPDSIGTQKTYQAMAEAAAAYRCCDDIAPDWKADLEADYRKRGSKGDIRHRQNVR